MIPRTLPPRCPAVNGRRVCRFKPLHKGRHAPRDRSDDDFAQCGRMRCMANSVLGDSVCVRHYLEEDEHLDEWKMPGIHVLGEKPKLSFTTVSKVTNSITISFRNWRSRRKS